MKIVFCVNDASFTRCRDNAVDNAQVAKICHQNITLFIYKKKKKKYRSDNRGSRSYLLSTNFIKLHLTKEKNFTIHSKQYIISLISRENNTSRNDACKQLLLASPTNFLANVVPTATFFFPFLFFFFPSFFLFFLCRISSPPSATDKFIPLRHRPPHVSHPRGAY